MKLFRQLLVILFIPIYLYVGAFIAEWISHRFGIWDHYVLALVLPLIGLISTYVIAPYFKAYNLLGIYLVGLTLAYLFGYPAQYPEGSDHPYQWTYRPFALTLVWSSILLVGCFVLLKYKEKYKQAN